MIQFNIFMELIPGSRSVKTKSRLPKFCGRMRDRKKWHVLGGEVVGTCFTFKKAI